MATLASDGSRVDVQAKIDSAVTGDVVTIPAGNFNWTAGISIPKGIHLQGAGSGRAVGISASLNSVPATYPTSKTFTLDADVTHAVRWNDLRALIVPGATLKIWKTGGEIDAFVYTPGTGAINGVSGNSPWMRGTVTSYNIVTRELVMSITSGNWTTVDRNVSYAPWVVTTEAATTIVKNNGSSSLIVCQESASAHLEISGIRFAWGPTDSARMIDLSPVSSGLPFRLHDCFFEMRPGSNTGVYSFSTRAVTWNNTFLATSFHNSSQPFIINGLPHPTDAWTTLATMGMADASGNKNFYISDSDFHGVENGTDFQDNGKGVVRYCVINNSGISSHGADTGFYGMRHLECYKNDYVFNGYNNGTTIPLNHFVMFRGGTGIVTQSVIPDIISTDYGNKSEIRLVIEQLDRNAGPNPLWSDNDGQAAEYPCPRQVGMGRVTGTGVDGQGRSVDPYAPQGWPGTYVGDVEPAYFWDNSRTPDVAVQTGFEGGGGQGVSPDLASDYIQAGRDYFNNGTAKPGWTPYTYPHPLESVDQEPPEQNNPPVITPPAGIYAVPVNVTISFS